MNNKNRFAPWREEMFYKSATTLGKVIIELTAPFVYAWRYIKNWIDSH